MQNEQYQQLLTAADNGTIADELNPIFIFHDTATELLCRIARGEFDLQDLARRTLEGRGLDINGKWKTAHEL